MFKFNETEQRKIAIANLSQLEFYINPKSGSVSAPLPAGSTSRFAIEASLRNIGVDIMYDVAVEDVPADAMGRGVASVEFQKGSDLLFDQQAVNTLIDAGISNPLLNLARQYERRSTAPAKERALEVA